MTMMKDDDEGDDNDDNSRNINIIIDGNKTSDSAKT